MDQQEDSLDWYEKAPLSDDNKGTLLDLQFALSTNKPHIILDVLGGGLNEARVYAAISALSPMDLQQTFSDAIWASLREKPEQAPSIDDIYMRAVTRVVFEAPQIAAERGLMLEALVPDCEVLRLSGWMDLFRKGSSPDDPSAYPNPKLISHVDVNCVYDFLDTASAKAYPRWNRILKRRLPKDLVDPKIDFGLIRRNKKTIAIAKSSPNSFGTHYVDPRYQRGFRLGALVQHLALDQRNLHTTPIYGFVAPDNAALIRHFHMNGILGIDVDSESDDQDQSEDLLKVVMAPPCGLKTVHRHKYPDAQVKNWAEWGALPTPLQGRIVALREEYPSREALLTCFREHFDQGFILTRFFSDERGGTSRIMVFEDSHVPGR